MKTLFQHDGATFSEIVKRHGPWTAMSIDFGEYQTLKPSVDKRLNRILQVASAYSRKPLSECRVLDIACLEGQYAIEFGLHGAQAVGVDIRDVHLAKAAFAAATLKLERVEFFKDDVRNINRSSYGDFDIVIASGILYHLPAENVVGLLRAIRSVCTGICILDTYIALKPNTTIQLNGEHYEGSFYREHSDDASEEEKEADLWASIDNQESFWFSEPSLIDLMHAAGFTSCCQVLLPTHVELTSDRRMYLLSAHEHVVALSSKPTTAFTHESARQQERGTVHPSQVARGMVFRMTKRLLPPRIKNMIKPTLRRVGLLDTVESPFKSPNKSS